MNAGSERSIIAAAVESARPVRGVSTPTIQFSATAITAQPAIARGRLTMSSGERGVAADQISSTAAAASVGTRVAFACDSTLMPIITRKRPSVVNSCDIPFTRSRGSRKPAKRTGPDASSSNANATPAPIAIANITRLRVARQRHTPHSAPNANAGARASAFQDTPRHQNVAPAAIAIIASAVGKMATLALRNHSPNRTMAAALATAARSRSAVRRPRATASETRAASVLTVGGRPIGTSRAGKDNCNCGASAGENT